MVDRSGCMFLFVASLVIGVQNSLLVKPLLKFLLSRLGMSSEFGLGLELLSIFLSQILFVVEGVIYMRTQIGRNRLSCGTRSSGGGP
jgi:hypothetical protein